MSFKKYAPILINKHTGALLAPRAREIINEARRILKREDRIVWYLKVYRTIKLRTLSRSLTQDQTAWLDR